LSGAPDITAAMELVFITLVLTVILMQAGFIISLTSLLIYFIVEFVLGEVEAASGVGWRF
jgi:hypothetical protein